MRVKEMLSVFFIFSYI